MARRRFRSSRRSTTCSEYWRTQDAMKVLVTGGTGYLGRAVVSALARPRHELVIFARSASRSGLPGTRHRRRHPRSRGGRARRAQAATRFRTPPRSSASGGAGREDFDDVNVGGLRNVLAAAAALRTPRVLYTSSFVALPPRGRTEPLVANDYQRTKVAADRVADEAVRGGCPLVRVYPGVVYGPGSFTEGNLVGRLIADHLRHKLPGLVGPEQRWSYAYVDDVAAGHCAALERGRIGRTLRAWRRERAAAPRLRDRAAAHWTPAAAARFRFRSRICSAPPRSCASRCFGGTPLITRGAVEIFRHDWSLDSSESRSASSAYR